MWETLVELQVLTPALVIIVTQGVSWRWKICLSVSLLSLMLILSKKKTK